MKKEKKEENEKLVSITINLESQRQKENKVLTRFALREIYIVDVVYARVNHKDTSVWFGKGLTK
ncbi:CLUMA_CG009474, isoform A [Clunio marinus]|uniref:CLUMA_CG009474, isoform A n=1 Tax=Clunio marinus TaxID=568069 RepID=A0A1J1I6Y5_9DIPT|nr:CLUMA_CG009474, isoform A [Clunio marinus]